MEFDHTFDATFPPKKFAYALLNPFCNRAIFFRFFLACQAQRVQYINAKLVSRKARFM